MVASEDASSAFLAGIDFEKRSHFEAMGDLDEIIVSLWREGEVRWPSVKVPLTLYATYLAERSLYDAEGGPSFPEHTSDLYLALACIGGDDVAIRNFETEILCKVDPVLARLGLSEADADGIRQELRVRLLVGTETRTAVLASYSGSGELVHWVRAVAGRQALQSFRRNKPTVSLEEQIYETFCDPHVSQLKGYYREEFKKALHEAVAQLDAREQTIMRALVVEGHTVTEVAQTYKVHRVTASRWVSKIRQTLFARTQALLRGNLNVKDDELRSIMRLIDSQMEMSLARVLE